MLNVEARIEQNYWVLSVIVRQDLGLQIIDDENALLGAPLTLEQFANALQTSPNSTVNVRLDVSTPQAKAHFDSWWAGMSGARASQADTGAAGISASSGTERAAIDLPVTGPWTYIVREAVGVLPDEDALETAVDELERVGFSRAGISVLGRDKAGERLSRIYQTVIVAEDDPGAPHAAFVSEHSRVEGETAAVALPLLIGGWLGAGAVVASGGILAGAIAATILGSVVGGGLGALLAEAVAQRHAKGIEAQVASGGLVLWVSVPNDTAERQAIDALARVGARDVHVHTIQRTWGPRSRPLADVQVDPFLEADPAV